MSQPHPLKEPWTAFVKAAAAGDFEVADRLLQQHPELLNHREFWGQTALHYLVIESEFDAVEYLISRGADTNTGDDSNGETPLHSACMLANGRMVECLLKAGANPNAPSMTYGTPLDIAFEKLRTMNDIADRLKAHGARTSPERDP
jgi:ankyrin repeat protein